MLALLAYLIQDWQTLQIVLSAIVLSLFPMVFFMPESPRWLIAANRPKEAFFVLNQGATKNKKIYTSEQFETMFESSSKQTQKESSEKLGFKTLFTEWYIAKNTTIISINFMVCSMCYYGLAMNQVNLGSSIYVSFVLGGVVEIVGYLFACFMIDHIGRRTVLVACQIVAGLSCIAGGLLNDKDILDDEPSEMVLALALIGNYLVIKFIVRFKV